MVGCYPLNVTRQCPGSDGPDQRLQCQRRKGKHVKIRTTQDATVRALQSDTQWGLGGVGLGCRIME